MAVTGGTRLPAPGDSYMAVTWQSHGSDMAVTWQSHGSDMAVTWKLHGSDMAVTWQLQEARARSVRVGAEDEEEEGRLQGEGREHVVIPHQADCIPHQADCIPHQACREKGASMSSCAVMAASGSDCHIWKRLPARGGGSH